jgi:hypothetical protein
MYEDMHAVACAWHITTTVICGRKLVFILSQGAHPINIFAIKHLSQNWPSKTWLNLIHILFF